MHRLDTSRQVAGCSAGRAGENPAQARPATLERWRPVLKRAAYSGGLPADNGHADISTGQRQKRYGDLWHSSSAR
jgi:hypothetical protein